MHSPGRSGEPWRVTAAPFLVSGTMSAMTSSEQRPPRKRRQLLWAALGSLALIGALATAFVVVTGLASLEADPVKDKAGLAVVRQHLSAASGDINALGDPANSKATGTAHVTACSVDSGEVFEPTLYREWRLVGAAKSAKYDKVTDLGRRAGSSIAAALIARGWSGSAELTNEDFPATWLSKRYDGYTVTLTIQVFDDAVLVSGDTKHPRVCRRHV